MKKKKKFSSPIQIFTHGYAGDSHSGLVKRLAQNVGNFFKCKHNLISVQFPDKEIRTPKRKLKSLKDNIRKEIEAILKEKSNKKSNLSKDYKNYAFINELTDFKQSANIFEITINSKDWTKETSDFIIKELFNRLFKYEVKNIRLPNFVFMNIVFLEAKKSFFNLFKGKINIEKEIEKIEAQTDDNCVILSNLNKIEYKHAFKFFQDKKFQLIDVKKFIKENEKLSFVEFFECCKNEIATYYFKNNDTYI